MTARDILRAAAARTGLLEPIRDWRWRRRVSARRQLQAERFPKADRSQIPIVFGNAMSKSGSQMLALLLEAMEQHTPLAFTDRHPVRTQDDDGRPRPTASVLSSLFRLQAGDAAWGYLPASESLLAWFETSGAVMFFLYRDPRDRIVSHILYAMNIHEGHAMRKFYSSLPSMEDRIEQTIRGVPGLVEPVHEAYASYQRWFEMERVLPVRFEALIQARQRTLARMLGHLADYGLPLGADEAAIIAHLNQAMAPEHSPTFRRGEPGAWREHFTARNIEQFEATAGDLLARLGYQNAGPEQVRAAEASTRRLS